MDPATTAAFVVLGLIAIGVSWWCLRDVLGQRRRARAEAWARTQVSPDVSGGKHRRAEDEPTVPLDAWPTEELEPEPELVPDLVRPYLWMREQTEVFPRIEDNPEQR